jgi:uncharacterized membrane protein
MASRRVAWAFVLATAAWPVTLGAALVDHIDGAPRLASSLVYLSASRICHQRVERSFATAGVKWPVCGRCAGLYLSAPLGALLALGTSARLAGRSLAVLVAAAVPTVLTVVAEWSGVVPVTSVARFLAAFPLGAALGMVLTRTIGADREIDQVH